MIWNFDYSVHLTQPVYGKMVPTKIQCRYMVTSTVYVLIYTPFIHLYNFQKYLLQCSSIISENFVVLHMLCLTYMISLMMTNKRSKHVGNVMFLLYNYTLALL